MIHQLVHLIGWLACAWVVGAGYWWIRRRSAVVGWVMLIGIVARVVLGVTLFWISSHNLAFARSLHTGDGFWQLAVDARHYYTAAQVAVGAGVYTLDPLAPSPFYTWMLTLWMAVVGVSPVAGMFLNLCLYILFAVLVVRFFAPVNDWRQDLPAVAVVTAYTFFPVILIHSTQPLKDELFNVVLATACFGVFALRRLVYNPATAREHWFTVAGTAALAAATFGAAGIRWYYGFMLWCAAAVLLALFSLRGRTMPLSRYIAGSAAVLALVWVGFWGGSGRAYFLGAQLIDPAKLMNLTQLARIGFLTSGGGTNVVVPLRDQAGAGKDRYEELVHQQRTFEGADARAAAEDAYIEAHMATRQGPPPTEPPSRATPRFPVPTETPVPAPATTAQAATAPSAPGTIAQSAPGTTPLPAPEAPLVAPDAPAAAATPAQTPTLADAPPPEPTSDEVAAAVPVTIGEHVIAAVRGVAIVFLPTTMLRSVAHINVNGGRGMLTLVDLDTAVLDMASLLVLVLLWQRRRVIGTRLPFVVFGLLLAVTSAVLMGYVVTNYGTLWRLRSLVAVPMWIVAVALSPRPDTAGTR